MSNQFADNSAAQPNSLAGWIYALLTNGKGPMPPGQLPVGEDVSPLREDYHPTFFQQLPNFALALIQHEPAVTTHYAPLLCHLLTCPLCHRAYLETYDALRVALADEPRQTSPLHPSSTAKLATTKSTQVVWLCQLLINQARSILREAQRAHSDEDAWARSLLQQAVQISRSLLQGTLRQRALRDLVEVASLTQPADVPPPVLTYAAQINGSTGTRGRILRRADMVSRPESQTGIVIQAGSLEGLVSQENDQLTLQLFDLNPDLRGKHLLISVPLGTLLEPVRWLGGNPNAIRSTVPVAPDGTLNTPLGTTDLRISNPEDRNLIETLCKKLNIYPAE
jgi:hypothetical protein